jgi:ssDNA thymidine ADP-ribosyltransferase, DarT
MPAPNPEAVRLFHITDVSNLPAICAAGALVAKNPIAAAGGAYKNIAYQGAQGKRARKTMPDPPGGTIHDYVPFYFAPRSPMLMAIHNGRVPGCATQDSIVHLETTIARAATGGRGHVFFDRNATLNYSQPYTGLSDLDKIAWDLLTESPRLDGFCKFFQSVPTNPKYADRLERRMAEFLVLERVPLVAITRIGVINAAMKGRVDAILTGTGVSLLSEVRSDWYFLPGQ